MIGSVLCVVIACLIGNDAYAASCEPGWREFKNNCYLFNSAKSSWRDARKFCEGKQGSLASVTSQDEHNFIVQQIILEGTSHNWIGGNDIGKEGVWSWEHTGERFKFLKWHPGQPSNDTKEQHCLLMNANVRYNWDNLQCAYKYSSVCEKPSIQGGNACQPTTTKSCTFQVHCR